MIFVIILIKCCVLVIKFKKKRLLFGKIWQIVSYNSVAFDVIYVKILSK